MTLFKNKKEVNSGYHTKEEAQLQNVFNIYSIRCNLMDNLLFSFFSIFGF